jgi:hypothetical protein
LVRFFVFRLDGIRLFFQASHLHISQFLEFRDWRRRVFRLKLLSLLVQSPKFLQPKTVSNLK